MCTCTHGQSCPSLCDPTDCSPPGYSVHGISQARILEWVAIYSTRGFSRPRDQTHISCFLGGQVDSLPPCHLWKPILAYGKPQHSVVLLVFVWETSYFSQDFRIAKSPQSREPQFTGIQLLPGLKSSRVMPGLGQTSEDLLCMECHWLSSQSHTGTRPRGEWVGLGPVCLTAVIPPGLECLPGWGMCWIVKTKAFELACFPHGQSIWYNFSKLFRLFQVTATGISFLICKLPVIDQDLSKLRPSPTTQSLIYQC